MIFKTMHLALAIWALLLVCGVCVAQQAFFAEGQAVEVREGDTWSGATIIKKEGRRYLIRYEGGTDEEWTTAERLRHPSDRTGSGVTPDAPPAAQTSDADDRGNATGAPSDAMRWSTGQVVEAKRGISWRKATVSKIQNGWVMVLYETGSFREWVEPWRLREPGSKDDPIGTAPMHKEAKEQEPPPQEPPSAGPAAPGATLPGWREPVPGDKVLIYEGGNPPKPGRLIQKRAGQVLVKANDDRSDSPGRWIDPMDVRVASLKLQVKPGQRVQVRDGHRWLPGTVMAFEAERAKVKLDGWDAEMFHKWKSLDELRPALASDVPPIDSASPEGLKSLPGYRQADLGSADEPSLSVDDPSARPTPDAYRSPTTRPAMKAMPVKGAAGDSVPKAVAGARGGASAVAVVASQIDGRDQILVDRFDLGTSRTLSSLELAIPKEMRLADVSPDGTRALFRKAGPFDRGDRVEIWRIDQAAPTRDLLLFPYAANGRHSGGKDLHFAAFVANDSILTAGGGDLHLWNTRSGKAIYRFPHASQSEPGLSANGKYIAFTTGKEALIVEATTGRAVLELPQELTDATRFAFSPSGKQLVACDAHTIWAVNLVDGRLYRHFTLPGLSTANAAIGSPADGYVLINGSILVDLERRLPVWRYELPHRSVATVLASGLYVVAIESEPNPSSSACQLIGATIPHPTVVKASQGLKAPDLLLKPGVSISLQMNANCSTQERDKILRHINEQLKANGMKLADGQPIQLVLSIEQGKSEQREYTSGPRFGPFARKPETVTFSRKTSRMRLVYQNKTMWEVAAVTGDPGFMLMKKEGQTAQQAVDELGKPNLSIFSQTRLPAYLVVPRNPIYLGASELSARGLRDKKAEPEPERPEPAPAGPPPSAPRNRRPAGQPA